MIALKYDQCVCDTAGPGAEGILLAKFTSYPFALKGLARAIEERLRAPGLAIIRGDALQSLNDEELSLWFRSLTVLLGVPVAQNVAGETLVEIADHSQKGFRPARGYQTNESMLLHSDASDIAALMCLCPAERGGESLFAPSRGIHDAIAADRADLIQEYFVPWNWNLTNLGFVGLDAQSKSPIFSVEAGELACRYGSHFLRSGGSAERPLTSLQIEALDLFEATSRREDLLLRYRLRRGDSVWLNNYRVLHGRDAFEDGFERRRMQRCWIRQKTRPAVGKEFAAFDAKLLACFGKIDAD